MPPAQWRWKYAGTYCWGTLVRSDGELIAFYGGMPRRVQLFGEEVSGIQIGDVMVAPLHRRVLTRRGPFFLVATTFAERLIGPDKPYSLSFGFPSDRHSRLGEHLGVYQRIGPSIAEASWSPLPYRPSLRYKMRPVTADSVKVIDVLWHAMSRDFNDHIVPVRDSAYIAHRFLGHPSVTYLPVLVSHRLTGKSVGVIIMRDHGDDGLELLDLIAPRNYLAMLVERARQIAGSMGRCRLFAWLSGAAVTELEGSLPRVQSLNIPLSTIIWKIPPDAQCLKDRWWLMGGDTDFR